MREHKYRGLTKEGKEVYGSLLIHKAHDLHDGTTPTKLHVYIVEQEQAWDAGERCWLYQKHEVIPESVCEFTGKQDSHRQDIYEGNSVRIKSEDYDYDYVSTVRWDKESGCLVLDYPPGRDYDDAPVGWILGIVEKENGTVEVIGNIHEKEGE